MKATKNISPIVQTSFERLKLYFHLKMGYEFSGHPVNIPVVSHKKRLLLYFLLVDCSPVLWQRVLLSPLGSQNMSKDRKVQTRNLGTKFLDGSHQSVEDRVNCVHTVGPDSRCGGLKRGQPCL